MPKIIGAYILWYDGEWECTYIGTNFDDAANANRKAGPADGKAVVWSTSDNIVYYEISLSRLVVKE